MEYAVTIGVVAFFLIIYLCTQPKTREWFLNVYGDDDFDKECDRFVKNMPLPKEGDSSLKTKKFQKQLKKALKKCTEIEKRKSDYTFAFQSGDSLSDYEEGGYMLKGRKRLSLDALLLFPLYSYREKLESLSKRGFASLAKLPSINKEPRTVSLARFSLAHSRYIFTHDRTAVLLNMQNSFRTLGISEIISLKDAYEYVLLEKLYFLIKDAEGVAEMEKKAKKYVAHVDSCKDSPIYKSLNKNRLFIDICALEAEYKVEDYKRAFENATAHISRLIQNVLSSLEAVELYDFSKYYTPLEILDDYEVFSGASAICKHNFLTALKELSDKENLDEFMYAIRLKNYMQNSAPGHLKYKNFEFAGKRLSLLTQPTDISMLGTALKSPDRMLFLFGENKKKNGKSILKNSENNNSYVPFYKTSIVNFGISVKNNKLKIAPHMPESVTKADILFENGGTEHTLHILRGDHTEMKLGNTVLEGIADINLGSAPVDITVMIDKFSR